MGTIKAPEVFQWDHRCLSFFFVCVYRVCFNAKIDKMNFLVGKMKTDREVKEAAVFDTLDNFISSEVLT